VKTEVIVIEKCFGDGELFRNPHIVCFSSGQKATAALGPVGQRQDCRVKTIPVAQLVATETIVILDGVQVEANYRLKDRVLAAQVK